MRLLQLVLAAAVVRAQVKNPNPKSYGLKINGTGPEVTAAGFQATIDFTKSAANDVDTGCREFFLIIARGSLEPGNIGVTTGPMLCSKLRATYNSRFGCQGVDPKGYSAGIGDNGRPKGTTDSAIQAGIEEFNKANKKCPKSYLLFSGYSQGAAVMHGSVAGLSAEVKKSVIAGALFGDTRYRQSGGVISGYPAENLIDLCVVPDDGVCVGGAPKIPGHLAYTQNGDIIQAVNFLSKKMDAAPKRS